MDDFHRVLHDIVQNYPSKSVFQALTWSSSSRKMSPGRLSGDEPNVMSIIDGENEVLETCVDFSYHTVSYHALTANQ